MSQKVKEMKMKDFIASFGSLAASGQAQVHPDQFHSL
jgi:hypothetical protein